jgi:hypothetical protein
MVDYTDLHVRAMYHRQFAAHANRIGWMLDALRSTGRQLPSPVVARGRRNPVGACVSRAIAYAASWYVAKPLLSSSDLRQT